MNHFNIGSYCLARWS